MRQIVRIAFLFLLAGCAASSDSGLNVALRVEQLTPYTDLVFSGATNVDFRITVQNQSDSDVVLRRLEMRTTGPGAYVLTEPPIPLDLEVDAKSMNSTVVTARATSAGGHMQSREPASVRAVGYFEGPQGSFTRAVTESFVRERD